MRFNNPYLKKAAAATVSIDKRTGDEFNPPSFGRVARNGKRPESSSERLFSQHGELNASNNPEALDKIQGVLDGVASGKYQIAREASFSDGMEDAEAEAILKEAFSDPTSQGFRMVGQGIINVIKEVIDYEGLARKVWMPRTVGSGDVIRYDKDPYVLGFQIAEDGQTPQSVVEGRYYYPPEFEVTAYPSIEIKDKFRAQFDIVQRAQDKARQAIEYQEDLAMINLFAAGANAANTTTFFAALNLAALESIRYQVERHRLVLDKFIVHRQEISDLVTTVSQQVDPIAQRELILAGYIGVILNAMVITTAGTNTYEILSPGEVYGVAAPEYLGGMPIRVELFSKPTDEFMEGRPREGWFFYELISMYLGNAAGVAYGSRL